MELLSAALITYDEKKTSKIEKLESSLSAITAQLEEKISCHISLQKEFDELLKQHDNIKKNKIALLEKHNVMEYNYEQQLTKNHEVSELQKDVILSNLTNAIKLKDEKAKLLQASLAASVAQCSELEMKKKFLIAENQNQYQRKESFLLTEEVKTLNIVIENLKAKMTDMSGKDVGLMNSCEKV